MLYINIQGVKERLYELNVILENVHNVLVVCINELKLRNHNMSLHFMLLTFIQSSSRGATVLINYDKNFSFKIRNDEKFKNEDFIFECSDVEITKLYKPTLIISLYWVPYFSFLKLFLSKLEMFMSKLEKYKAQIYFATDYNINVKKIVTCSSMISSVVLDQYQFK